EEGGDFVAVDRLFRDFGMPMGPFTLLDEIGIDVAREVGRVLYKAYGSRMEASPVIEALAGRADLLGKKTGKGFYLHRKGKRTPNPEIRGLIAAAVKGRPRGNAGAPGGRGGAPGGRGGAPGGRGGARDPKGELTDRPLLAMVNEAARALQEGIVATAQEADLALIMGTGFPPFRGGLLRWADSRGVRAIHDTLIDLARRHGVRFTPAPLLATLASEGRGFYSD
ncbi:MAG TPA: 3-hydroxyacyl-CoA dehydrogenase family protein, partial [bacterium]|nr:3-hydroxyacyl-CoA dehydrogenase family protein [bacterium]